MVRGADWLPFVEPRSWLPAVAADVGERHTRAQDDVWHWLMQSTGGNLIGAPGRGPWIHSYARITAFAYESDASYAVVDALPVTIRAPERCAARRGRPRAQGTSPCSTT